MKKKNMKRGVMAARDSVQRSTRKVANGRVCRVESLDEEDQVKLLAIEYCLFHYPTLYKGGIPRHASLSDNSWWIVPIVLTDPYYGIVGEVGQLLIDLQNKKIMESTARTVVIAVGSQLYKKLPQIFGCPV